MGEYLFLNLYQGDEDRLGRNDPGKTDSLHDVSAGCGIPYSTLHGWVRASIVLRRLRSRLLRIRGLLGKRAAPLGSAARVPATVAPLAAAALPSPFPPGRESREIERAIAFVAGRVRAHRTEFALEVGRYLFENLFRGDLALYHQGGAWRERAIARIAADPRVDLDNDVLEACIHTWVLTRFFGRRAADLPLPDLSPWTWDRMFCLAGDPAALVAVASWAGREGIDQPLVRAAAQAVRPYLEAGGRLEDLLPAPSSPPPDTPYRRISRVLGVVESHLASHPLPAGLATRAATLVDRMLEALSEGPRSSGTRSRRT